jgi:Domain of unknown function (DUF4203)
MDDWVLAILLIAVGALFNLRGYVSMRLVFALWGALAGFGLGAGAVAAITGDGFLATTLAWLVGGVTAIVVAALAYLFYAVSVLMAMSVIGYVLGATLITALGVQWQWLIALVGIAAGIALAILALRFDLPSTLLIILTAAAGAAAVIAGIMLLVGTLDADALSRATVTERLDDSFLWWLGYAALAVVGIVVQTVELHRLGAQRVEAWSR